VKIVVREEQYDDIQSIHAVTRSAFLEVGHSSHTEHFIVDALCDSSALYISLVADLDGQIIEHVWISPISISDGTLEWVGLGPIAVLSVYQKQGDWLLACATCIRSIARTTGHRLSTTW
jgi:putative acetyltransferase